MVPTSSATLDSIILSADDFLAKKAKSSQNAATRPAQAVPKPITTAALVARAAQQKRVDEQPAAAAENNVFNNNSTNANFNATTTTITTATAVVAPVTPEAVNDSDVAVPDVVAPGTTTTTTQQDAAVPIIVDDDGGAAPPPLKKKKKSVSWASDDSLVEVREYVPENPKAMISLREAKEGKVRLAKMDVAHERELSAQKKTEVSSKDVAKNIESAIVWYRPAELKIDYGEDGPPRRGEQSDELATQRKREEGRLGTSYSEKNLPPDDPHEPPSEPDYDPNTVPLFVAEVDPNASFGALGGTGKALGVASLAPLLGFLNAPSISTPTSFPPFSLPPPPSLAAQTSSASSSWSSNQNSSGGYAPPSSSSYGSSGSGSSSSSNSKGGRERDDRDDNRGGREQRRVAKRNGACHTWTTSRSCRFGDNCMFQHDQ